MNTTFNKASVATLGATLASLLAFFFPTYAPTVQYMAPLVIGAATYFIPNAQ